MLQLDLEWVLLSLDAGLCHESILVFSFGLFVHFPSNGTELLEEDLFGMLRSLRLHVAHDLAALAEVELSPVTDVHLQNVSL